MTYDYQRAGAMGGIEQSEKSGGDATGVAGACSYGSAGHGGGYGAGLAVGGRAFAAGCGAGVGGDAGARTGSEVGGGDVTDNTSINTINVSS